MSTAASLSPPGSTSLPWALWSLSMTCTKRFLPLGNRWPAEIWLSDTELQTTLSHLGKEHERGGTAPPTPAFLRLTKPSAIFKQLPKPAPCVVTDFTRAATSDKDSESAACFLGNVRVSCSIDAHPPTRNVQEW